MTYEEFSQMVLLSMEDICRDIYRENIDSIKIKKEDVVVKNLVTIFNATLKLSNLKGFHAMSLRDLSSETGLSMGALYSYFSSKDELLGIIQYQGMRITHKILIEQIEAEERGPQWKMRAAIRTHLYLSELMRSWFYFSYMEAKNLSRDDQRKAIQRELFTEKILINILDEGKDMNVFSFENSELTASSIKALLQDWYLKHWKYSMRKTSIDEYAKFIIGFIENNIIPGP